MWDPGNRVKWLVGRPRKRALTIGYYTHTAATENGELLTPATHCTLANKSITSFDTLDIKKFITMKGSSHVLIDTVGASPIYAPFELCVIVTAPIRSVL